jgi:hypothetical protein
MLHTHQATPQVADSASLEHRIVQLKQENDFLRRLLGERDARIAFEAAARRNPAIAKAERTYVALRELFEELEDHQRADGSYPIVRERVANIAGISVQAVSDQLKFLEEQCHVIERTYVFDDNGRKHLFVRPPQDFWEPAKVRPVTPVNRGGVRERKCSECGSDRLVRRIVEYCEACGTVHKETARYVNDLEPDDVGDQAAGEDPATQCQIDIVKNLRGGDTSVNLTSGSEDPQYQIAIGTPEDLLEDPQCQIDIGLTSWMLKIAGEGNRHIVMRPSGDAKYVWRYGQLTPEMIAAHLQGKQTYGATFQRSDGSTLQLLFDEDTEAGLARLRSAYAKLKASGAYVALERSPAGRGAHLMLFFAEPVDAAAARATALAIAPELADVREYWPHPTSAQAARLPFGYYSRPGAAAWCPVMIGEETLAGLEAALRVYESPKTPAAWVNRPAEVPRTLLEPPSAPPPPSQVFLPGDRSLPLAMSDPRWLATYGDRPPPPWFAWTAGQAAAYFNARHEVAELLPLEGNGYARASWRGERTPSVRVYVDHWLDYGAGGRRDDGTPDGGDALEAFCRREDISRTEALRRIGRELQAAARAELEVAARAGRVPAAWVASITTPAGWDYYDRVAAGG